MRNLLIRLLEAVHRSLVRPRQVGIAPPAVTGIAPDGLVVDVRDIKVFQMIAVECQMLARAFGDRQNSESKLTAKEATKVVTTLLNAGNLLAVASSVPKPQEKP